MASGTFHTILHAATRHCVVPPPHTPPRTRTSPVYWAAFAVCFTSLLIGKRAHDFLHQGERVRLDETEAEHDARMMWIYPTDGIACMLATMDLVLIAYVRAASPVCSLPSAAALRRKTSSRSSPCAHPPPLHSPLTTLSQQNDPSRRRLALTPHLSTRRSPPPRTPPRYLGDGGVFASACGTDDLMSLVVSVRA